MKYDVMFLILVKQLVLLINKNIYFKALFVYLCVWFLKV